MIQNWSNDYFRAAGNRPLNDYYNIRRYSTRKRVLNKLETLWGEIFVVEFKVVHYVWPNEFGLHDLTKRISENLYPHRFSTWVSFYDDESNLIFVFQDKVDAVTFRLLVD